MRAQYDSGAFTPVWPGLNHAEDLVWDADRELLYAGGENGEIYRGRLDGAWEQITGCGENSFVLGITLDAAGDLYVCERGNSRVLRISTTDFTLQEISRGTPELPMVCPNYPSFDASGRLLISDSGTWGANDGRIYTLDPTTGTALWSTVPSDFTNGIALSPDEHYLYVVESHASKVSRIAINDDGSAGATELVWHVPNTVPDGLAFDQDGLLYIGCYTPDSIYLLNPSTGDHRLLAHDWSGQHLQAPTNLAFVGAGLDQFATANLCGHHLNIATDLGPTGHALLRPEVTQWAR